MCSEFAYYNSPGWGPSFGISDLSLLYYARSNCNHGGTFFHPKLRGNRLCGADRYDSQNKCYVYEI